MANILTFKFLRDLQKKERASRELEKLDSDFYRQVSDYMEKKTGLDLKDNLDFAARRDLEHTRIIIKDILNRRERKVINLAVLNARGNIVPKNILPEEKDLFNKIQSAVTDYRSNFDSIFYENGVETEDKIEQKKPEKEKQEDTKTKNTDDNNSRLRTIDTIPAFIADDGNSYGPFEKDQEIDIPPAAAEILIKIKKAEQLE